MEVQHCPLFKFAKSLYKFRTSNTSTHSLHNRDIWYPMSSSQKGRLALTARTGTREVSLARNEVEWQAAKDLLLA